MVLRGTDAKRAGLVADGVRIRRAADAGIGSDIAPARGRLARAIRTTTAIDPVGVVAPRSRAATRPQEHRAAHARLRRPAALLDREFQRHLAILAPARPAAATQSGIH